MLKNYQKGLIISAAVSCVVAFTVLFATAVSFGASNVFTEFGGAISLSFDKAKMRSVNRAVISNGEKTVEITDPALIQSLVQETMVATHTGLGCSRDRTIELYSGNTLVRSMIWSTCCGHVLVYTADIRHWIVPTLSSENAGFAFLSASLEAQLNELLSG